MRAKRNIDGQHVKLRQAKNANRAALATRILLAAANALIRMADAPCRQSVLANLPAFMQIET